MPRFDISRLRKENGMSQNELAQHLQMTQSFLSAIENGKSPLPIEKEEKLCEIFGIPNLKDYITDKKSENSAEAHVSKMTDSDLFNQLLSRFHKQAHSAESEHHHHDHHQKIQELESRLDVMFARFDDLMARNDRLTAENERLREQIDAYRTEIDALRKENYNLSKK
ncbi:MAG: helix-turn-helix domain-containing protein [Muribaculaceae bacterium]|nr:helix-turn-helix domain-containing protein [Muribaculaceae bacterium]